jgi:hypothetical protein
MNENGRTRLLIDNGANPYRIPDNDPLLAKLLEVHGDRFYEDLKFENKRRDR